MIQSNLKRYVLHFNVGVLSRCRWIIHIAKLLRFEIISTCALLPKRFFKIVYHFQFEVPEQNSWPQRLTNFADCCTTIRYCRLQYTYMLFCISINCIIWMFVASAVILFLSALFLQLPTDATRPDPIICAALSWDMYYCVESSPEQHQGNQNKSERWKFRWMNCNYWHGFQTRYGVLKGGMGVLVLCLSVKALLLL